MNIDIGFWATWVLLGVACVFDLVYKKIPFLLIICGGAIGGVVIAANGFEGRSLCYALIPGMLLLLTAFLTGEKVGYGDGMLLLVLGLLEGAGECLGDLLIGLFLVIVFAILLLILGRKEKNTMVPFAPFLMVAHTVRFLVGI